MLPDQLPGAKTPYLLRSGSGKRYLVGGLLATVIAHNDETDGLLEAVVATQLWASLGQPYDGFVHPEGIPESFGEEALAAAERVADIRFLPGGHEFQPGKAGQVRPEAAIPYVLASGEVERLIAGDQLFAFLAHGATLAANSSASQPLAPRATASRNTSTSATPRPSSASTAP